MKFADRLKVTSTGTSAASLTLGAAAQFCRTLAQAIASGDMAVGDTGVPFSIDDGAGNWEDSYFTITSSTVITRERVVRSSAAGAAPTYSGATLTVYNSAFGDALAGGLLDPNDVGFDIVLIAGQSNPEGNPASDPLIDIGDPRVWQWANTSSDAASYRKIISGADPLYMPSGIRTGKVGPGTWFAKAYLSTIPQNRKVLLVPVAVGSTAMVASPAEWSPSGGTLFERAISDANLAIAAAQALYPNSRFVGTLFGQGEADGVNTNNPVPQWQYAMNLKALIAGFRSRITGASNSWFIISSMTPEGMVAHTGEVGIDLAHKQVAAEVDRCVFIPPVSGMAADVHYTAPGVRIMGSRMGLAVPAAKLAVGKDTTAPVIVSAVVSNSTPSIVSLTFSELMDASSIPAGSSITIAGHVVNSVAISGNTGSLNLATPFAAGETLNGTYAQPGSNKLKDQAGNLLAGATFAITNNVVGADTTKPTVSGTPQIADATPNAIVITFSEPLAAGNPPTSAFPVTGTQTSVASVTVSGSTVTLTMGGNYVAGNTASVSYAPSGTNDLQDAAGNKVDAFGPIAVTNNVAGGGVTYATMSTTDKDSSITLSGGNLIATGSTAGFKSARANTGKSSGKWYWEAKVTAGNSVMVGVGSSAVPLNNFAGSDGGGDSYGYYSTNGNVYNSNGNIGTVASYTTNDVIGVALDMTAKTLQFYKNGVGQGVISFSGAGAGFNDVVTAFPMVTTNASGAQLTMNFGATAFTYTPPTGYSGLTA